MSKGKLGALRYDDGSTYIGEVKDGKKHGQGTHTYRYGIEEYVGEWKDDLKHGQGTYTYANGDEYVGEWKDDLKHGQGTYINMIICEDGDIYDGYVGEWKDDVKHGQGTYSYGNGDEYDGEWENDMQHGQGTLFMADGDEYDGEWKDGVPHGQGTATFTDGGKYDGEWKDGKKHGQGTLTFADGDEYDGEWKDNMKHGQGTLSYADGRVLAGKWVNNEYDIAELEKMIRTNDQEIPKEGNKYYEEKAKGKNPILAIVLGIFLGPIGMLYFGWRTFASILLTVVIVILLNSFYFDYDIPGWTYLNMLYFGIWGLVLASFYGEKGVPLGLGPLLMCRYYFWLNMTALFLISIIQDLREGYYFLAALDFFIYMPLIIFLFTMAISHAVKLIFLSGKMGITQ